MKNFAATLLPRAKLILQRYEHVLLAILAVVIVISGTVWYRQYANRNGDQPTAGGTYIEGVVKDNQDIQIIAAKLTKAGLFRYDSSGAIQNQLISTWTVNADKDAYTFTLLPEVKTDDIINDLQSNVDLLGPAEVNQDADHVISLQLPQPNPNLPLLLAQPLFDYGPYKVSKTSDETTIFTRNTKAGAINSFLNKIIIHTYPDETSLRQALLKGKLTGAVFSNDFTAPPEFQTETILLPKFYAVIFNLNKSPFRDAKNRRALIDQTPSPNLSFTLTAADQEPSKSLANDLITRWQTLGSNVTLQSVKQDEIRDKIAPSRDFQALLIGINYTAELDPYYIWHSSQIRPPGNNFSGLKSDKADTILTNLRATLNVNDRQSSIKALHAELNLEGAEVILRQESVNFVVSTDLRYQMPWLPVTNYDRFQAISQWSVK